MTDSSGAASRVADALRAQIAAGALVPGMRLSEERVKQEHGVSRSTLREAFRLLIRERLLVHELSRGVFVRQLSRQDVADLYEVRRVVECAALRHIRSLDPAGLRRVAAAVKDGREVAERGDWDAVAAASIRFHEALVALAGSPRLNALVSDVLAEFRLAYAHMRDTQVFHAAFLKRNAEIAETLGRGDIEAAAEMLDDYLVDAEKALQDHFVD
ncbi:GntR family transcriptional regulator [Saccharopolyspora hordei]|uniref:DNA-binding GntR family transcriptional regulator n=1 Tax=Saccharopolyspora hordei TaxID=1838 RepID=A0A853AGF7_9PSEU|nr:DNA-binding GntR family transcriptional regulator [Saccharopolyspora hordei]